MRANKEQPNLAQSKEYVLKAGFFNGLDASCLQNFAKAAQTRNVDKGTLLYIQDDTAKWFYVIESGWVKLFRENIEGSEAIIDVLSAGHMFGENSIFENDQYSYSVQVVEDTVLHAYPTNLLKESVEINSQLALNMLKSMSNHRLQQQREIEHFNLQNAPQRIGCFLLRLISNGKKNSAMMHLPYDKTLIAGRLGMKPETFSRALSKLKKETGLRVTGSMVKIDDIAKLSDYVCRSCSNNFPRDDI